MSRCASERAGIGDLYVEHDVSAPYPRYVDFQSPDAPVSTRPGFFSGGILTAATAQSVRLVVALSEGAGTLCYCCC